MFTLTIVFFAGFAPGIAAIAVLLHLVTIYSHRASIDDA